MMTSAVQCIIILACTAILTSSGAILQCRCLNTGTGVRVPFKDIVSAAEFPIRPHCNKKEVIITLITGREVCLDPSERYTQSVLRRLKARDAPKNTTTTKPTAASSTTTTTASASSTTTTTTSP